MINKLRDIKRILFGAYGYKFTSHPQAIAPVLLSVRGIIKNNKGEYLMVQRAKDDRREPLYWEFPGGKIDRGEYNPINALRNEISQETNLKIEIQNVTPFCSIRKAEVKKSPYENFLITTLFYKCIPTTLNVKISSEHENYMWINNEKLNSNIQLTIDTSDVLNSGYLN